MRRGLIVVMLAVTASCASSGEEVTATSSTSTTTTTSTSTSSTTTAPPTTTTSTITTEPGVVDLTDPDTPAPAVDLRADTFEELARVWSDIDDYLVWLYAHPTTDEGAIAVVIEVGSPEFDAQKQLMDRLATEGQRLLHHSGTLGDLSAFSCCPDPQPGMDRGVITVAIQSRAPNPAAQAVDGTGEVIAELPGWDVMTWMVTFRRGEDEGWRVVSFQS